MKTLALITLSLGFVIGPKGCKTPPAPPPADVPSASSLGSTNAERLGTAAAAVAAAREANQQNSAGPARDATEGALSVAASNLPTPPVERLDFFRGIVAKAFAGKLDDAESEWAAERGLGSARLRRIAELEEQVKRERSAAAEELKRQLAEARDEARRAADAKERLVLMVIFFGLGAACIIGAVLVGQLGVVVPMFGPRAAVGFGIAGALLIVVGILVRFVDRLMERHPVVFWGGILAAVFAAAAAALLIYANHRHHHDAPAPA